MADESRCCPHPRHDAGALFGDDDLVMVQQGEAASVAVHVLTALTDGPVVGHGRTSTAYTPRRGSRPSAVTVSSDRSSSVGSPWRGPQRHQSTSLTSISRPLAIGTRTSTTVPSQSVPMAARSAGPAAAP